MRLGSPSPSRARYAITVMSATTRVTSCVYRRSSEGYGKEDVGSRVAETWEWRAERVKDKKKRKKNSNGKLIYIGSSLIWIVCFVTSAGGEKNQLEHSILDNSSRQIHPTSPLITHNAPSAAQLTKTIKHLLHTYASWWLFHKTTLG